MLDDEPTGDSTPSADATDTPTPPKKAVRRRATSKVASDGPAADAPDDAGTETDDTPAPAKKARARKAAAKP